MARLQDSDGQVLHLVSNHIFGRLATAVDTEIRHNSISRIHFCVEFHKGCWWLVDYSRNGTWLNGIKLNKNQRKPLKVDDQITFGQHQSFLYHFIDNAEPRDLLCLRESAGKPILQTIELLPNKTTSLPNAAELVFTDPHWAYTYRGNTLVLADQDWVDMAGENWQLMLVNQPENTAEQLINQHTIDQIELHIFTSLDEETTRASIHVGEHGITLKSRSHLYLMLLLARAWVKDYAKGTDRSECGWMYVDELSNMLNMPETALNIQVYRMRKQLLTALEGYFHENDMVIRRRGQLKLGFTRFAIFKGDSLESKVPSD